MGSSNRLVPVQKTHFPFQFRRKIRNVVWCHNELNSSFCEQGCCAGVNNQSQRFDRVLILQRSEHFHSKSTRKESTSNQFQFEIPRVLVMSDSRFGGVQKHNRHRRRCPRHRTSITRDSRSRHRNASTIPSQNSN
ncbi:hypothetical protein BLNAU_3389 [Blattamonas nauphoetae]|uniref:Uncharacterized protein n=1 Tax=Blattamonas nauphoetae TaxID=2049346 RepID=A0ABQ9YCU4_9EUKA|nr:hypothetical protein BLNAU_3389 [Blattamonas nauphoetae]